MMSKGVQSRKGVCRSHFYPKQIGEKALEKKCRVYVCFMDLEKAYDRANIENV